MILREAIDQYITWRRAQGMRLQTQAYALQRFSRGIGDEVDCDEVRGEQVSVFLAAGATTSGNRAFVSVG